LLVLVLVLLLLVVVLVCWWAALHCHGAGLWLLVYFALGAPGARFSGTGMGPATGSSPSQPFFVLLGAQGGQCPAVPNS
jgi:hypothetical protein